MKRFIYTTLVLLLAAVAVQAQNDNLAKGPDIIVRGPIIDNINANTGTLSAIKKYVGSVDNVDIYDGQEDQQTTSQEELGAINDPNRIANVWGKEGRDLAPEKILQELSATMRFYPNPAISQLNVDLGDYYTVSISLVNVIGQEVFRQQGEIDRLLIDVSSFQPGFYLLHIQMGGESLVKRIEIVR